jgi:hypothetical protein
MRAARGAVKETGKWPPQQAHGRVRRMGKALFLLLVVAVFAVFLVPVGGKTLWDHAHERGFSAAASSAVRQATAWIRGSPQKRTRTASADAPRTAHRATPERILKAPPKERLSPDDRASLDRLVHTQSR